MKKIIFALGIVAILASCRQPPDPAFCWQCTQRFIYNSTDTTPTIIKFDTLRQCDQKQSEIDQFEANNAAQIYNTYTKDAMRCVRQE
jgi:hypothetical protein